MSPQLTCQNSCPIRYFGSNRNCVKCSYDCYTCTRSNTCLTCNDTTEFRILSANGKRCLPLVGYFDNKTAVCVKCPNGCFACISLSRCISCLTGFFFNSDGLCYSSCPQRTFPNVFARVCFPCYYTCATCSQPKTCSSCNSTYDFRVLNFTKESCQCLTGFY